MYPKNVHLPRLYYRFRLNILIIGCTKLKAKYIQNLPFNQAISFVIYPNTWCDDTLYS